MPGLELPDYSRTNIWLAAAEDRSDLVEHFLKYGGPDGTPLAPDVKDENGYTPLHAAVSYSNIQIIKMLVTQYNADVNVTDNDGDTPLHVCETVEAAECLKELGADMTRENDEGKKPIETAYAEELDDVVEYLKQFTPDIELGERDSATQIPPELLHLFANAVENGTLEVEGAIDADANDGSGDEGKEGEEQDEGSDEEKQS